jgi:hypothetical protein
VWTTELPCLQEVPPTEPVDQGNEGEWDTVGEHAGSRSPAPTVEELLAQMERQPPAPQRSAEPAVDAKSALNAKHTASRTKLASHAQRAEDVPVNFFLKN